MNVLAAYVFTVRRFNGDHHNEGGGSTILRISTNLDSNQNFEENFTAVDSVIYHANNVIQISIVICVLNFGCPVHFDAICHF